MIKKLLFGFIILLLLSAAAGYFYFKDAFKAPANLCTTEGDSKELNIHWVKNGFSQHSAMLLPIKIDGIADTLWMQFDLGASYSVLYSKTINSLSIHYPNTFKDVNNGFQLKLGGMLVAFDAIPLLNFGNTVNLKKNQQQKIIIGTLGTDFLENTKALINFKYGRAHFFHTAPDSIKSKTKAHFEFKERRVLITGELDGAPRTFMWDTGASAYSLISSESNFQQWRDPSAVVTKHPSNQLTRKLTVHTAATNLKMTLAGKQLAVESVTYIEGFPWYIKAMFKLSGMEGMIGNNLFNEKTIYLDCAAEEIIIEQAQG